MTQKELEMKIIAHICTYEEDMIFLIAEGIDEKFFIYNENSSTPMFKQLFLSAYNYYRKFNRLLSQAAIESQIKQKENDASNKILSLFKQVMILSIDPNAFPMLLQDLRTRKMNETIQEVMETIDVSLKNDNALETFDKIKEKIQQAELELVKKRHSNKVYLLNEAYTDILDTYQDKKDHPEKYKGIDIGLHHIDEATNGFKPSTLNIVVGASGAGKSVILTNWAAEVYKRNYNVLFFSLEMPLQQVISRYISRELCLDYKQFYNGTLEPEDEKILTQRLPTILGKKSESGVITRDGNDSAFVIITNFNNPDIDYIEAMVKHNEKIYGKIDAIFVDYLNNMRSQEILKNGMPTWAHSGECAAGLRRLAANYGLTVFTAQQMNRSGLERGRKVMDTSPENFQANQEDMGSSQSAFHDADSVIGFNPDRENNRMHFKCGKGRDFRFEPFFANYYPTMNRIVDCLYDDTSMQLSPWAAQENRSQQLSTSDEDVLDRFNFEDGLDR